MIVGFEGTEAEPVVQTLVALTAGKYFMRLRPALLLPQGEGTAL